MKIEEVHLLKTQLSCFKKKTSKNIPTHISQIDFIMTGCVYIYMYAVNGVTQHVLEGMDITLVTVLSIL